MATADLLDHTSMGHGGKGKDACASSPDDGIGYSSSGAGPSGPHVENSPSPPDCPPGRHASSSSPTSTCAEPGPAGWGPSGGVKMERTSHVDSLSGCESVGSSGDAVAVAKFKHKLVEQSRREKTRALTSELQAMVPALADFNKGTNINVVLEGVLQYLRDSSSKDQSKGGRGEARERVQEQVTSLIRNKVKSVPWGISQKAFAFSPVGMVCSSTSGQLLWFNQSFGRMFSQVLTPEEVTRPSMFSLTAPESLPETMQVLPAPCRPGLAGRGVDVFPCTSSPLGLRPASWPPAQPSTASRHRASRVPPSALRRRLPQGAPLRQHPKLSPARGCRHCAAP